MKKNILYVSISMLVVLLTALGLLFQTQLAAAQFTLPAGATVTKATLSLYVTSTSTASVNVHRITSAWTETTVTWNSFAESFDPGIVGTFIPSSPGWQSVDVTSLVQDWVSGSSPNDGFLLEQGQTSFTKYLSSDSTDGSLRPKLEICYTVLGGAETCATIQRPGPDATEVFDAYIWLLYPDNNNGTSPDLYTGLLSNYEKQTLIQFDFFVERPAVTIVKYTNGSEANDPNGPDVPQLQPGDSVTWTYKVTNTGNTSVPKGSVVVTDNQTGVTPAFEKELIGNGDEVFDPGEVWQYVATGIAVDLTNPPTGVITEANACTLNQTQPPRTAYVNQGKVTIPGASDNVQSSYCNPPSPGVAIIKYTNGQQANDPNGSDVPRIQPGDTVTWTYKVTNTGNVAVAKDDVVVTDNQTGVTPAFEKEISGNGDEVFDPGEVWQYVATGIAVDLTDPPQGVITEGNACTLNGAELPRTAYVNQGTVTIPDASDTVQSSYCNPLNPGIAIIKYTNGKEASDPNGIDVPQIKVGDPVTWTYQVTNTGEISYPLADVIVTDNQPGVTPVYDHEITGNGDEVFDPGEVWLYKATGTAVDTTLPPQGVNIVQDACSYNESLTQSPAYVNTGTVTVPDATASADSSYCNPIRYPNIGENGYIGIEDWINGDYDYNDFGFYFRIEEIIEYVCPPGGTCGPYLTHITITTNAVIFDSGMYHLIHLHRAFNGPVHYTVSRVVPADPNTLTLFDGATGKETPAGSYVSASGDVDVVLYNTAKYAWPQKQINEPVVVDFIIDQPLLNPRVSGTYVRSYTVGSTTFHDLDPIMSEYDFWEEGTKFQSRWHLKDTRPVGDNNEQILVPPSRKIPDGTVLPFLLVVPYNNWIPPFEGTTITSPYASFGTFYTTSDPGDWYIPDRVTNNCVMPFGVSFGPYPGTSTCARVFVPAIIK